MRALRRVSIPIVLLIGAACGGANAPVAASPGTAATATPAPSPTKLVVGYSEVYEGMLPLYYAFEKGIFKQNGIEADLRLTTSSTGIAAILANEIQVFMGGGSETLSANVAGAELLLIGNVVPIYPYVFLAAPEVKTLADLKGKKVGVSMPGSTSDIATRIGLARQGIDPDKDVTIVAVGSSQNRTAALKTGSIQGGLDQPPFSYQLQAQGLNALFDMASLKLPVVNNGIVVQKSFAASNRALVQRYIDSMVQSLAAIRKDRAGAIVVLKAQLKVDDEQILSKTYDYAMGLFPSLPYAKPDQLADSVKVLAAQNPKVAQYDLSKMLDESFVKSAAERGLDKP